MIKNKIDNWTIKISIAKVVLTYLSPHFQVQGILEECAILQPWLLEMFRDRNWLFQKVLHSQGQRSWYALANALWNIYSKLIWENFWNYRKISISELVLNWNLTPWQKYHVSLKRGAPPEEKWNNHKEYE